MKPQLVAMPFYSSTIYFHPHQTQSLIYFEPPLNHRFSSSTVRPFSFYFLHTARYTIPFSNTHHKVLTQALSCGYTITITTIYQAAAYPDKQWDTMKEMFGIKTRLPNQRTKCHQVQGGKSDQLQSRLQRTMSRVKFKWRSMVEVLHFSS